MKTQKFGVWFSTARVSVYCLSEQPCASIAARSDYKKKRNNLVDSDEGEPKFDGNYTWTKGRVRGDRVYGDKRADGRYDYEVRYNEGSGDMAWMENNDRIYLNKLLTDETLQDKEPAVLYLREMDMAQDRDIGLWWVEKLARLRKQNIDIDIALEHAKAAHRKFGTISSVTEQHSFVDDIC